MNRRFCLARTPRPPVTLSMIAPKVMQHPLVTCHLTVLRNKNTRPSEFRSSVNRLSTLLAYSATEDLQTTEKPIETPIQKMVGQQLLHRIA